MGSIALEGLTTTPSEQPPVVGEEGFVRDCQRWSGVGAMHGRSLKVMYD